MCIAIELVNCNVYCEGDVNENSEIEEIICKLHTRRKGLALLLLIL